jgi:hypothetical protein
MPCAEACAVSGRSHLFKLKSARYTEPKLDDVNGLAGKSPGNEKSDYCRIDKSEN